MDLEQASPRKGVTAFPMPSNQQQLERVEALRAASDAAYDKANAAWDAATALNNDYVNARTAYEAAYEAYAEWVFDVAIHS